MRVPADLASYEIGLQQLPTLHYIPDAVTEAEEASLLQEVHASKAKWVQLSGRRLQNHGGVVSAKGSLIPAPLPTWLAQLLQRLPQQLLALFPPEQPPNHVLINAYQPGCGIMPHEDGPLYHPVVLILSLGSPAVLRFWRKHETGGTGGQPPVASLLALPRSLLVFQDEAYTHCLHGIEEVTQETLDNSVVNMAALQKQQAAAGVKHDAGGGQAPQQEQEQQQPLMQVPPGTAQQQPQQQPLQPQQQCSTVGTGGGDGCCTVSAPAAAVCGSEAVPGVIDRQGERVSLTIRRVLRVSKALGALVRR